MASTNYKLLSYNKIPSTQTMAEQMVIGGDASDKLVIMAEAQSSGRGRGANRKWISHHGNLYASFLYKYGSERRPTLSYAFAVAAAETLLKFKVPVQIKWPNDLLADGKKIAGMLLEYLHDYLIVGIGINIKTNPSVATYDTAKTDDFTKGLSPNQLLNELIKNFEKWRKTDFESAKKRWEELSFDIGTVVKYHGKQSTYCGLTNSGAMILRIGDKYELVFGDEIFA